MLYSENRLKAAYGHPMGGRKQETTMNKVRVLIAEDSKIWQHNIRRWLERYNCYVDVAGSYDEARQALNCNAYDIVILDMLLDPDEEGPYVSVPGDWQLLVHQLTQSFPDTVVYVISAILDEPERICQLNQGYGVRDFMAKSDFSHEILKQWVDKVRQFKKVMDGATTSQKRLVLCENRFDSTGAEMDQPSRR